MYVKFEEEEMIRFYGKLWDEKWSTAKHRDYAIAHFNDEYSLEMIANILLNHMTNQIFNLISNETKILAIPTKEQISKLIKKSVFNIIYGEELFGELINKDLMAQIIKETLDITLKYELKDGNKRTAWFFFIYIVQNIYLIEPDDSDSNRSKKIGSWPIFVKMNELILDVSTKGNKVNTLDLALKICDNYREELSIINFEKEE